MGVSVSSQGPGGKIVVRLLVFVTDHDIKTQISIKSDYIKSSFFSSSMVLVDLCPPLPAPEQCGPNHRVP